MKVDVQLGTVSGSIEKRSFNKYEYAQRGKRMEKKTTLLYSQETMVNKTKMLVHIYIYG